MRIHSRVIPSAARDLLFNAWRVALLMIAFAAAFSLSAQAQEPVPLARGNTPGEPHHHLKIENEYVRVYYVEVPPHEDTQLHQHDHDYIYVSLGPADVVNAILNKPEIHLQLQGRRDALHSRRLRPRRPQSRRHALPQRHHRTAETTDRPQKWM